VKVAIAHLPVVAPQSPGRRADREGRLDTPQAARREPASAQEGHAEMRDAAAAARAGQADAGSSALDKIMNSIC
jgi:hypothetical protein